MLKPIVDFFMILIQFSHQFTHSYGLDIILLTVIVRLALHPLTYSQIKSAREMRRIQPKIQELQKKYKKDPEKLNKELTALYQKEGVNPFAGCVTLLIQIPILWALFYLFAREEYNHGLFKNSFFLGAQLTTPAVMKSDPNLPLTVSLKSVFPSLSVDVYLYIPSLILVAIYIASTILFQKQVQSIYSQDGQQSAFNPNFLIGLIIVIGFIFPAGVLLYFITSNFITMAQQALIIKQLKALEKKKKGVVASEADSDSG